MAELTYRDAVIRGIAQEYDVGIAFHFLRDAADDRVAIRYFRHSNFSMPSRHRHRHRW